MPEHDNDDFQQRLDWLFEHIRRPNGKPYTISDIARRTNGVLTPQQISHYRSGIRRNPTRDSLFALARAFGISPEYFVRAEHAEDLVYERMASDRRDVQSLAFRAAQLTPEAVQQVIVILDALGGTSGALLDLQPVKEEEHA